MVMVMVMVMVNVDLYSAIITKVSNALYGPLSIHPSVSVSVTSQCSIEMAV